MVNEKKNMKMDTSRGKHTNKYAYMHMYIYIYIYIYIQSFTDMTKY